MAFEHASVELDRKETSAEERRLFIVLVNEADKNRRSKCPSVRIYGLSIHYQEFRRAIARPTLLQIDKWLRGAGETITVKIESDLSQLKLREVKYYIN